MGLLLSPLCELKKKKKNPEDLDNTPKSHRHQTEELEIKLVCSFFFFFVSYIFASCHADFPGGSDGKASVYNAGDRVQSLGGEDLLEKEMAIHSSTIAWKIPWTEETGRQQSMGSQRVGHD